MMFLHNLRNNCIRLPAIRCEFGKLNAQYQMHFRLRELANPSNPPLYPNINIDNDVTTRSLAGFSKHIKSKFLSGYVPYFLSSCLRACPFNYLLPSGIIYYNYL